MLEESPVKESQSNGEVERAIQEVQGQVRTTKAALESRYENRITEDHPCLPWLVSHSADTLRRFQVHKDGKTAYQRVRGKAFRKEVMEFGECVWYYKPGIKGKSKLEPRYESGVWLGMTDRSGETYIGTPEGVLKVRSVRKKAGEDQRWNWEEFRQIRGVPWEPVPGQGEKEVRASVKYTWKR